MKELLKIFICHHKDGFILKNDIYEPIQSGRKKSHVKLDMIGDDTGDNISIKNENYAELDVLYWIWKNKKYLNFKYIGLCHFRRYFDLYEKHNISNLKNFIINKIRKFSIFSDFILFIIPYLKKFRLIDKSFFINNPRNLPKNIDLISFKKIILNKSPIFKDYLIKYDIIIPKKLFLENDTIDTQYRITHISEDFRILKKVLLEKNPELKTTLKKFCILHFIALYNLFIMKQEIFNNYCEWLFDILFEVEKRVIVSGYDRQKKVFAYMGERLLNLFLYINKEKFKVKEIPFFFIK